MGNIQKTKKFCIISLLLICLSLGQFQSANAVTGNFFRNKQDVNYYPETKGTLYLTNLSIGYYYGLLIGANQNKTDQQWINFTASGSTIDMPFIHFDKQSYFDNRTQEIQNLFIILYSITSDNDNSPVQLDTLTLYVVTIKQQINPPFVGMLLFVIFGSIAFMNIVLAFVKQFW